MKNLSINPNLSKEPLSNSIITFAASQPFSHKTFLPNNPTTNSILHPQPTILKSAPSHSLEIIRQNPSYQSPDPSHPLLGPIYYLSIADLLFLSYFFLIFFLSCNYPHCFLRNNIRSFLTLQHCIEVLLWHLLLFTLSPKTENKN